MFPFTTVKNRLCWSLRIIVAKKPHIVHISNRMIMTLAAVAIFFPSAELQPGLCKEAKIFIKNVEKHVSGTNRKHSVRLSNRDKLKGFPG